MGIALPVEDWTRTPHLDEVARAAERLAHLPTNGEPAWLEHAASAALHTLLATAAVADAAGAPRAALREAARPARIAAARSGLIAHAQTWPLGYPGDVVLIDQLIEGRSTAIPGSMGRLIDELVQQLPIVWQHRNKVAWQAGLVRGRLGGAGPLHVLSLGCGSSADLGLLEDHELARLHVTLSDAEPQALERSRKRLEGRVASLELILGNVLRIGRRARPRGPFDLVLAGGLLDYVPTRAAELLVEQVLPLLAAGGTFGVTNIATDNPWRLLLEVVCDWPLIERSAGDMERLLDRPGFSFDLSREKTRLTWLATTTRR
jgi:SAM-dependent methyltransferase